MSESAGFITFYFMLALWALLLVAGAFASRLWAHTLRSPARRVAVVAAARPTLAALLCAVVVTTPPIWLATTLTHPDDTPWVLFTVALQALVAVPFWLIFQVLTSQTRVAVYQERPDLVGRDLAASLAAIEDFDARHSIPGELWERSIASSTPPSLAEPDRARKALVATPALRPAITPGPRPLVHRRLAAVGLACWIAVILLGFLRSLLPDDGGDGLAALGAVCLAGMVILIPIAEVGARIHRHKTTKAFVSLGTESVASELGLDVALVDAGARDDWLQGEMESFFGQLLNDEVSATLCCSRSRIGSVHLNDIGGLTTFTASIALPAEKNEPRLPQRLSVAGAVLPQPLSPLAYVAVVPRWLRAVKHAQYHVEPREFGEQFIALSNSESALHGVLTPATVQRLLGLGDAVAVLAADRWIVALSVRPVAVAAASVLELVAVEAVAELARVRR